jgi:hypothetical protein
MKKTSVTAHSPSLELPQLSKIVSLPFIDRKTTKEVRELKNAYVRPTEEFINQLNRLGQEYPFCAYYKEKTNDPL